MRDIAVTLIILIGLLYTIKKPYVGVLLWSWLSYMNPHRLCYGFAYTMPFAQMSAIVTIIMVVVSKERKSLPKDFMVYLLIIFIMWMGLTTLFAFNEEAAKNKYIEILKIQLPVFLTLMMFNSKERLHHLLWVIIISLGYFSIKGGVFTLLTAGSFRVYGPPNSVVEENNALAIATLMVIPLMIYLRGQVTTQWKKQVMLLCIFSMSLSVIGSQSRGAFLAILVVGGYYWLRSNQKIKSGFLILCFVMVVAAFLPDSWYERMNTIGEFEEDDSAMGRINAWKLAINVANQNLFGGGLNLWGKETYINYLAEFDPLRDKAFVAHSIYFSILAEHGWLGLFMFLLFFYLGWRYCNKLIEQCDQEIHLQWIADLSKMMKVGLLAYLAGGAFLSLSYFDLTWHYLSIIILLKEIASKIKENPDDKQQDSYQPEEKTTKVVLNSQGYLR